MKIKGKIKQLSARGPPRTQLKSTDAISWGEEVNMEQCYLVRLFPFAKRNKIHSSPINWAYGHRGKLRGQEGEMSNTLLGICNREYLGVTMISTEHFANDSSANPKSHI